MGRRMKINSWRMYGQTFVKQISSAIEINPSPERERGENKPPGPGRNRFVLFPLASDNQHVLGKKALISARLKTIISRDEHDDYVCNVSTLQGFATVQNWF